MSGAACARASRSTASSSCSKGREFLVEDHYCANPECDCQQVHLEFWQRVHEVYPQRRITIRQRLMATFSLAGALQETRFSQESAATAKYLLQTWLRRGGGHFQECRRRYERIKAVSARSFPPKPRAGVVADKQARSAKRPSVVASPQPVRRNDPCPCGSGLKFKRCCARRSAAVN